jgi:hypothetical protein
MSGKGRNRHPFEPRSVSTEFTAKVPYEGEVYHVTYSPHEVGRKIDGEDSFARCARIITKWDILGDDGQPLPIAAETFTDVLPADFVSELFRVLPDDLKRRADKLHRRRSQ